MGSDNLTTIDVKVCANKFVDMFFRLYHEYTIDSFSSDF